MKGNKWLVCLVLGALFFMVTGLQVIAAEPIKIGMTVSSTGRFAMASQSGERGLKVWIDDVNQRGGIELKGEKRKIELVQRDDRSDKTMVPRVYETLITDDKVDICFAPFGSTLTGTAVNVSEQFNKFMMIWSAGSDKIYAQNHKYIASVQIAASLFATPGVKGFKEFGVKSIAFANLDEPFPAASAAGCKKLAEDLGIEVTMAEKWATGTKDFSIIIQKAMASGAETFYPIGFMGDMMTIARQLREYDANFKAVYLIYASMPQFLEIGDDADYLFNQTLLHEQINWQVTHGLNREEFIANYNKLFPNVAYPADFQTALAYSGGVVLEQLIKKANSLEAAKLKQAALDLSSELVVLAGPYKIEESGKQVSMEHVFMQNLPDKGPQVIFPKEIRTAEPVFPVPPYSKR
jgi:branched-chain amino acid transport system substrate-binding protein